MKSPAFQWYAADYLADERVMLLSLESEAAYVRLLNYCWREGSIPSNPALCAPMCKYADVKVIKPALALFMKSPTQPGRLIHKRLEEEREKQEAFRLRQSEKGAKGGRPRKDEEKPEKPTALPGLNHGLTGEKPEQSPPVPSSLSSTSSSMSSNEDEKASAPAKELPLKSLDPAKHRAVALTDPEDEQHWSAGPLTKPLPFKSICERNGYPEIDFEFYRKQALAAAEAANVSRTIAQWNGWVRNYLNNQSKEGPLRKPSLGMPTEPTPSHLLPKPGQEAPGQVIAIRGDFDQVMNRQLVASYQNAYPNATIHAIR